MVWFGQVEFGLVWFLVLQSVKEVLLSILTKFELSTCLVHPTVEINICSVLVIKSLIYTHTKKHTDKAIPRSLPFNERE